MNFNFNSAFVIFLERQFEEASWEILNKLDIYSSYRTHTQISEQNSGYAQSYYATLSDAICNGKFIMK